MIFILVTAVATPKQDSALRVVIIFKLKAEKHENQGKWFMTKQLKGIADKPV